jgi:hypothetical protein
VKINNLDTCCEQVQEGKTAKRNKNTARNLLHGRCLPIFFIGRGSIFAVLRSSFMLPSDHAIHRNQIDIECCLAISYVDLAISCNVAVGRRRETEMSSTVQSNN